MDNLFNQFDRTFDLFFKNLHHSDSIFNNVRQCKFEYPVDIFCTETEYLINIVAIGYKKEDISIVIENNDILKVVAEKKNEPEDQAKKVVYSGIVKREFNFAWKVSSSFDIEKVTADLKDGLLTIKIPFAETHKPINIKIN